MTNLRRSQENLKMIIKIFLKIGPQISLDVRLITDSEPDLIILTTFYAISSQMYICSLSREQKSLVFIMEMTLT